MNLIKNKIYLDSKYKGCSKIKAVIITLLQGIIIDNLSTCHRISKGMPL